MSERPNLLPIDHERATLVARVWSEDQAGPCLARVEPDGTLTDLTALYPTSNLLFEQTAPATAVRSASGVPLGLLNDYAEAGQLLSPVDLQSLKAAGVTFSDSMIERTIENAAAGKKENAKQIATALRAQIVDLVGDDMSSVAPGSAEALRIISLFKDQGVDTAYLQVGLGPLAEIFTKAPPGSSVGSHQTAGYSTLSDWVNPEPEIVLVLNSRGEIVGATLGNDINDRGTEGQSPLLLGEAKDTTGSTVLGPVIRLFDEHFTLADIETAEIHLAVSNSADGFEKTYVNDMGKISRSPQSLAEQLFHNHGYPDGAVLFLGTMVIPTDDRDTAGAGFTHKPDDLVTISSPRLGTLVSTMQPADSLSPWSFGTTALMRNLAQRGLWPS